MGEGKEQRDRQHNVGFAESYVSTANSPWSNFVPGIQIQLLRVSPETGRWSVLFKCAAGSSFARHEHLGGGEYLMLSGTALVRGGAEKGGVTAVAGDFGYEPNGMIHDITEFPEETVLYFSNDGPLKFIDDDDNVVSILDWRAVRNAVSAGDQTALQGTDAQEKRHA
jgi:anti-sigma factor ChrR (cupin superfamily)